MNRHLIVQIPVVFMFLFLCCLLMKHPPVTVADDSLSKMHSISQLKKHETLFKEKPSVYDGAIIVNISYFLDDYGKAIHYGKLCLNLGANETSYGHLINLWLSASYLKIGKFNEAKEHLRTAIELDKKNVLNKTNAIEDFGLQEVYDSLTK